MLKKLFEIFIPKTKTESFSVELQALKADISAFYADVKRSHFAYSESLKTAVEALELIKHKHPSCDCMDAAGIAKEALEKIYGTVPALRRKPL